MKFILCFFLIYFLKISEANTICETCKCVIKDVGVTVDCKGRKLTDNEIFRFSHEINKENRTITSIDLSQNMIETISEGSFQSLENLTELDLSHNQLKNIHVNAFSNLKSLEVINLSQNKFESIPLTYLPSLRSMNFSYNFVNDSTKITQSTFPKLTELDLSHNLLNTLVNVLGDLKTLQSLNLSSNNISSLELVHLPRMVNLTFLDLSNNSISSLLSNKLPAKLNSLNVGFNNLTVFPENVAEITFLNIEHNRLSDFNVSLTGNILRRLNLKGNNLESFPNVTFSELEILDLSNNKFENISQSINSTHLPKLQTLDISENPLKEIKFESKLRVQSIIIRNVSMINNITEDAFKTLSSPPNSCTNVTLSGLKNLTSIPDNVFDGLNICYLDLSENGFTQFSSNLTNKLMPSAKYGINLQGNPFNCNCTLQWMVNDLVPWLYTPHQNLLMELRCANPSKFSNVRMVHWYKWAREIFCEDDATLTPEEPNSVISEISLQSSSAMLMIVIGAILIILVLFIIGILLIKKAALKRSRANRRF